MKRRGPPDGPAGPNGGVELSWTPPGGQAEVIPANAYRMNDAITCMSPPPGETNADIGLHLAASQARIAVRVSVRAFLSI